MFARSTVTFLAASVLATLVACHQAKPATTPYEAPQASTDPTVDHDRAAREAAGFAPLSAPAAQPLPAQPAAYRWPAPAPEPIQGSPDDPLRVLELP